MQIDDFERGRRDGEAERERLHKERPWRKDAQPLGKALANPNYPKMPFSFNDWMKSSKKMEEDSSEVPEVGDTIRTKKMQMEGKVEKIGLNRAGYEEVLFRIEDGRLMKTPLDNVIVIQKLADEDNDIFEERTDEVSTELLAKYKTAAAKDARESDKRGDYKRGNKRFSGMVKATKKQFANDAKNYEARKKSGVEEDSRPQENFSIDDIKRLETVTDLRAAKEQAKNLVDTASKRRMKPEKIQFFFNKIDSMTSVNAIVKLMYDLLLSGEGHAVIGSRNSMGANSYRRRFGEGSMGGINRVPELGLSHEDVLDEIMEKWLAERDQISFDMDNPPQYPIAKPRTPPTQVPLIDPFKGDPAKQAKAPKNARQGNTDVPFSELVQDTIRAHGVKWAFDYYVKKHGLPPRQFKIYAGL